MGYKSNARNLTGFISDTFNNVHRLRKYSKVDSDSR